MDGWKNTAGDKFLCVNNKILRKVGSNRPYFLQWDYANGHYVLCREEAGADFNPFLVKLCVQQLVCYIWQWGRWHYTQWLLSSKHILPLNTEEQLLFCEHGPCFNGVFIPSQLWNHISGDSLALALRCFRNWSQTMIQNTTCCGSYCTCSTDKTHRACPGACRLNSKAEMTVAERLLFLLKHSCHIFIILNQKHRG